MQTIGATLLGIKRCSLGRVRLAAHDGPSMHGLLYLAAAQLRTCQRCAPNAGRPRAVALPMPPVPQVISTVRPAIGPAVDLFHACLVRCMPDQGRPSFEMPGPRPDPDVAGGAGCLAAEIGFCPRKCSPRWPG